MIFHGLRIQKRQKLQVGCVNTNAGTTLDKWLLQCFYFSDLLRLPALGEQVVDQCGHVGNVDFVILVAVCSFKVDAASILREQVID